MKVGLLSIKLLPPIIPAPCEAQPIPMSRSITPAIIGMAFLILHPSRLANILDLFKIGRRIAVSERSAPSSPLRLSYSSTWNGGAAFPWTSVFSRKLHSPSSGSRDGSDSTRPGLFDTFSCRGDEVQRQPMSIRDDRHKD